MTKQTKTPSVLSLAQRIEYKQAQAVKSEMVMRLLKNHPTATVKITRLDIDNKNAKCKTVKRIKIEVQPKPKIQPVFNATFKPLPSYLVSGNNRQIGHKQASQAKKALAIPTQKQITTWLNT